MARNYLRGDSIAITSTVSPEARVKALCSTRTLVSIRAQQLAANTIRSRVAEDKKCDLPDVIGPRLFDSKLRTALGGLVRAPILEL
jgi:hypothetical protein